MLSWSLRQRHASELSFHKRYILMTICPTSSYTVSPNKFLETNSKVYQLPFKRNHRYVEEPEQFQSLRFLLHLWQLEKCFGFSGHDVRFSGHECVSSLVRFTQTSLTADFPKVQSLTVSISRFFGTCRHHQHSP